MSTKPLTPVMVEWLGRARDSHLVGDGVDIPASTRRGLVDRELVERKGGFQWVPTALGLEVAARECPPPDYAALRKRLAPRVARAREVLEGCSARLGAAESALRAALDDSNLPAAEGDRRAYAWVDARKGYREAVERLESLPKLPEPVDGSV
jgi:hypothetical protein